MPTRNRRSIASIASIAGIAGHAQVQWHAAAESVLIHPTKVNIYHTQVGYARMGVGVWEPQRRLKSALDTKMVKKKICQQNVLVYSSPAPPVLIPIGNMRSRKTKPSKLVA